MSVSAQLSVYPLRQDHLMPAIEAVQQALRDNGLHADTGPMSTYLSGEDDVVFAALRQAFAQASVFGPVVMSVTISNACPVPG